MNITLCEMCGGVTSITYSMANTISTEHAPVGPLQFCFGHPKKTHDGALNKDDTHHVYYNNFGGVAISCGEALWMSPKEALSLLSWLEQEEETLKRMADE